MASITFSDILEAADRLPLQDQEDLIRILHNRLRAQKRATLVHDVQDAQQEFVAGDCRPVTPDQLMDEVY